jgi:CubicO group peptidase (beta-lactamase class C family)/beta-lactamase regulating signal transducer with metallopeptidase domain
MNGPALLSAVLASLWLGALLAPAALLVTRAWPRLAARERHTLWWVVLLTVVLAPLVTEGRKDGTTEGLTEGRMDGRTERPSAAVPSVVPSFRPSIASAPEADSGPASPLTSWSLSVPARAPKILTLVWIVGALLGLLALGRELALLSGIRRSAAPPGPDLLTLWRQAIASLPTRRVLRLLVTDRVTLPAACGYSKPAVLVPESFEYALEDDEMHHLLLHELAHLARRDDWSLALERLIRVFWWWHPVVWWIGRRLDAEREMACDEAVASRVDRRVYARTLLHVAELSLDQPAPELAPGALRGRLTRRIEALMAPVPRAARLSRLSAAGVAALAIAGVGFGPPSLRLDLVPIPAPVASARPALTVRSDASGVARGEVGFALDSLFSRFADSGFSGTVLVALGNDIVLEKGYGLADRERGIPATAETRYSAAGITKLFTAAAVLSLEAEGKLSVHDPLSAWTGPLPDSKAPVTLHQLLTHTDGLTRQSAPVYRRTAEFVRAVAHTPSSFAPGQGYRYNDFGHSLLGYVVQRASGTSYEEFIRHRFLKPAGLAHTGFESDRGTVAVEYAGDRAESRVGPRAYVWGRRGSLGMVTTAGDLYRWFRAMDNPAILAPAVRDEMLKPLVKTDWGAMQGYGWDFHTRADGRVIWRRVAGTPGFEGEVLHDPVAGWTAVILVNSRIGWRFKVWDAIERAALLSARQR